MQCECLAYGPLLAGTSSAISSPPSRTFKQNSLFDSSECSSNPPNM